MDPDACHESNSETSDLGGSAGNADLAEKIGKWIDHPSWDPVESGSDEELCRQLLAAERHSGFDGDDSSPEIEDKAFSTEKTPSFEGRFRIEEKIGEGAFGIVFRAFDHHLKRNVAVKVLRPSLGRERKLFRRFVREAQAVATLRAQGVVQIFDVGQAGGQPYFVMELIEGPSLQQWASAQSASIATQEIVRLFRSIVAAVSNAHARGILHRDLKPSNILLRSNLKDPVEEGEERVVLTDFGLAKNVNDRGNSTADLTFISELVGTVRYMSPEQASGKNDEITTASDVFSSGVILYELLTGQLPFQGETQSEVIHRICHAEPKGMRSLRYAIPSDLFAILLRCLEKKPESRYASAAELLADLDRFLGGVPVEASNPSLLRRAMATWRHYPIRSFAVAAALSCLVVYATVWAIFSAKERAQYERADANLRLALSGIGRTLYTFSEKLNAGKAITHEENLEVLRLSLGVHEQLVAMNPEDTIALHHLAIAHYYLANAYARLLDFESNVHHREQFRDITLQTLEKEPDNLRYQFDGFMSNYLLASEKQRLGLEADDPEILEALDRAEYYISHLVDTQPENVDYRDALNTFLIFRSGLEPITEARLQKIQTVIDSATELAKRYPEDERFAKPALLGLALKGREQMRAQQYREMHETMEQANSLLESAYPVVNRAGYLGHDSLELKTDLAYAKMLVGCIAEADQAAIEAIDCWHRANEYQTVTEEYGEYLANLWMLRSCLHTKMQQSDTADEFRRNALRIAQEKKLLLEGSELWKWFEEVAVLEADALLPVPPF